MEAMQPGPGPSDDQLKHLHQMLPSMVKGLSERKIGGRGKRLQPRKATKCCPVCAALFDFKSLPVGDGSMLKGEVCDDCGKLLKEGCTAFVCGDKYAIVKPPPPLADMAGQIVKLSPQVFEKLENKHSEQIHARQQNQDSEPPEAPGTV